MRRNYTQDPQIHIGIIPLPPHPTGSTDATGATVETGENTTENGGDTGPGSNHENVKFGFGGKTKGISHQACHGHSGNACNGVAQEFGAETLPGRVGERSSRARDCVDLPLCYMSRLG